MANVILRVKREDGSWAEIPALVGPEGPQGVSIDDIVLKSQEGGVSTYLILLSDGSEKTFQVTDGAIITDVSLISTDVLIDTYKISISDGSFFNFKVTNGRGIKSIAKTSTDVLSDTYTISYNDNTSSTFKVTNGRSITKIVKSNTDVLTDTYTISYNDNTTSTYTITNGRGIDYIEKDETIGISDRYTIHYNDGSTSYYHVVNGEAGPAGSIGNRIYLSGLVDKVNDEEGYGRVKELKESDFDLSKFTVVGSPVISEDGVASGFSENDYINLPVLDLSSNNFIIETQVVVAPPSDTTQTQNVFRCAINQYKGTFGFLVAIDSLGRIYFSGATTESVYSTPLVSGTKYNIKVKVNNSVVTLYLDNNEIKTYTWGKIIPAAYITLGTLANSSTWHGSIDLKSFSITVDGKEVFSGNPTAIDTIKANNYTTVGSPTISSDGIYKANASSDCVYKNGFTTEIKKELRCDGRFYYKTKDLNNGNALLLANGPLLWTIASDGLITLTDGTNTSTVQIEVPLKDGDIFDTEIIYNASTVTLNVCLNEGVNYTTSITSQGLTTFNTWRLSVSENYWGGTIDLNTIHVYIDGNLVYQPCLKIPYTKAKTGSKIVDAAYRLRVEDCYNQYGAGNYYLFSNATEQFALPMPDIYGLIEDLDNKIVNLDNKKVNRAGDTMTGTLRTPAPFLVYDNRVEAGVTPSENTYTSLITLDKNSKVTGYTQYEHLNNGSQQMILGTMRTIDGVNNYSSIGAGFDANNVPYTYAPHPANKLDNSNKLATTNWVRNHCCTTPATTTSTASLDAPCYVIENYVNGTSWYRKYSDKWIEQGNKFGANTGSWADVTFNLLKSFTKNNYIIHLQGNWSSPECSSCLVLSKSATAIKVRHANNYYSTMPSTYVALGY